MSSFTSATEPVIVADADIGSNEHDISGESVSRTCHFSKAIIERIIAYSITRANEMWGDKSIDAVNMAYKFHLFDGVFSIWAKNGQRSLESRSTLSNRIRRIETC